MKRIHYLEYEAVNEIAKAISAVLEANTDNKPILFACIGSDRSTGDCYGPLTGSFLRDHGIEFIGELDDTLHAKNLYRLDSYNETHFIIAIDSCLSSRASIGEIVVEELPLKPGAGTGKNLGCVGNASIKGIVNVTPSFLTDAINILQNTRLSVVMKLSKLTSEAIVMTMKEYTSGGSNVWN